MSETLQARHEFFFAYDIRMGNPNGDPDENRPRVLPDGTFYVTDVRLKRFVRDFLKTQGQEILVDVIEGKTTNLTGRVAHYLKAHDLKKVEGAELVEILLKAFIDARMFGSSFAFKSQEVEVNGKKEKWEPKTEPKTLTGAVQINHGEVLHEAEAVDIHGTSIFGSQEDKSQGTFTTYFGLRYALIGFNGIANEHSAKLSKLSDADYATLLRALWKSVRSAGNTRTKVGQVPRLLLSIDYKAGSEFQFGNLLDYVKLEAAGDKKPKAWSSPDDYVLDLSRLKARLAEHADKIDAVRYQISSDMQFSKNSGIDPSWKKLELE
jgi:CRISPR-associated protein Csh2